MPDPFEHVVVLMMENRAFDHILGDFRSVYSGLEGIDPKNPGKNSDAAGKSYSQEPKATAVSSPDPAHDTSDVLQQISNGTNSGFIVNYAQNYPTTTTVQRQQIMDYFPVGGLFATHELARNFPICDHWYSSVPGPTWTNRFFVHSGTSIGRVAMPSSWHDFGALHIYDQTTLYDQMNRAGVSWRIYAGDIPQSIILTHQWRPQNARCYSAYSNFRHDVANGSSFPQYVFIEPKYMNPANDDHPDHSVFAGEALIADVYNTLRSNPALWKTTLLVLVFDEHGGFYDHVPPGPAVPPDAHKEEYTFDQYGLRVPALLISDWLDPEPITGTFDHTSLLAYVIKKWNLNGLGARTASAQPFDDFWKLLSDPRTTTPQSIVVPAQAATTGVAPTSAELNQNQRALLAMADFLGAKMPQTPEVTALHAAMAMTSPATHAASSQMKVQAFLQYQAAKEDSGEPPNE